MTELWAAGLVIVATLVGAGGSVLLKLGSTKFSFHPMKLLCNYQLLFGLFLYAFSALFFVTALRGGELSVLYPIVSFSYVWVSLLCVYFLSEKMNIYKWAGIALIIAGVSLIGLGSV